MTLQDILNKINSLIKYNQLRAITGPILNAVLTDIATFAGLSSNNTWQDAVVSIKEGGPPVSPSSGDRYLIKGGTGAWSGKSSQIAQSTGTDWTYKAPTKNMHVIVQSTGDTMIYDGTPNASAPYTYHWAKDMLAAAMANKINKSEGIELESGKSAILTTGDWNDYRETGHYKGRNLLNEPDAPGSGSAKEWKLIDVIKLDGNSSIQKGLTIGGSIFAYRTCLSNSWGPWHYLMDERDKTELYTPKVVDVDLTTFTGWSAVSKTLTVPSTTAVIKFASVIPSGSSIISYISSANPARVTGGITNAVQEGQTITFTSIIGSAKFTALNSGTYVVKNINYVSKSFDIYESDGTTPYSTLGVHADEVTDAMINSETGEVVITTAEGSISPPPAEYTITGVAFETSKGTQFPLDGGVFTISNVGSNKYVLNMEMRLTDMSYTYISGGDVYAVESYSSGGKVVLSGKLKNEVSKIIGIPDGKEIFVKAAKDQEILFDVKSKSSVLVNGIVGAATTIVGYDKGSNIAKIFRDGSVNLIYGKETF